MALLIVLAGAALLLLWWWWWWWGWRPAPAPQRPPEKHAAAATQIADASLSAWPAAPASAALVGPSRPAAPAVRAEPQPAGAIALCGLGSVGPGMSEAEIEKMGDRFEGREAQAAMERLIDRLAARSDLHHVAALALRASLQAERDMNQEMPNCAKDDQACAETVRRWHLRRETSYAGFAAQALPLAMRSREPAAFALASQLCEGASAQAPHDCGTSLLQTWAATQPHNAAPWLVLSGQEHRRGNLQAAEEALYRASQARSLNFQTGQLMGLSSTPDLGPEGGLAAVQLQARWSAVFNGLGLPGMGAINQSCQVDALSDANRRQRCEALAELMVSQAPDMLSRVIGRRVGERLGWPAARMQALDDHALALQQMQTRQLLAESEPFSCAALERQQQRGKAIGAQGEVAYLDAQMKAQGLSHRQLADELRAQLAQARVRERQRAQPEQPAPSR